MERLSALKPWEGTALVQREGGIGRRERTRHSKEACAERAYIRRTLRQTCRSIRGRGRKMVPFSF